jgi:hypothetical protein
MDDAITIHLERRAVVALPPAAKRLAVERAVESVLHRESFRQQRVPA